jgi:hypothetical protein
MCKPNPLPFAGLSNFFYLLKTKKEHLRNFLTTTINTIFLGEKHLEPE